MEASRKSRSQEPLSVYSRRGSAVLFLVWTLAVIQPVWSHQHEPAPEPSRTASRPETMCSQGSRLGSAASVSPDTRSANFRRRDTGVHFRIAALQVLVPVTVTDGTGRPVKGLHLEDFRLWEDGVERPLDDILTEVTPLTLGVVVDVSGSMHSKMQQTVDALTHLLAALGENDRAFLLGFHERVVTIPDLTCDLVQLPDALARFHPNGTTAMFDGVVEGLYRLYKLGPRTWRTLILLSDGFDNASINTPRETAAAAKATGVPIYAVGIGKNHRSLFSRILGQPHYLLSYSAPRSELDGRWHSLRVELSRSDLLARFRPGYLALPLE